MPSEQAPTISNGHRPSISYLVIGSKFQSATQSALQRNLESRAYGTRKNWDWKPANPIFGKKPMSHLTTSRSKREHFRIRLKNQTASPKVALETMQPAQTPSINGMISSNQFEPHHRPHRYSKNNPHLSVHIIRRHVRVYQVSFCLNN